MNLNPIRWLQVSEEKDLVIITLVSMDHPSSSVIWLHRKRLDAFILEVTCDIFLMPMINHRFSPHAQQLISMFLATVSAYILHSIRTFTWSKMKYASHLKQYDCVTQNMGTFGLLIFICHHLDFTKEILQLHYCTLKMKLHERKLCKVNYCYLLILYTKNGYMIPLKQVTRCGKKSS